MADTEALYELLAPSFDLEQDGTPVPLLVDRTTASYLERITTLSTSELTSTEPASLSQAASSLARNIQALSKRSHKAISASAVRLATLSSDLPALSEHASGVKAGLPSVESKATAFADKYKRTGSSDGAAGSVLLDRKNALLLSASAERLSNVLDLPTLLSSAIASGQMQQTTTSSSASQLSSSTGSPLTPTALPGSPGASLGSSGVGPNTAAASSAISSSVNYGSALDLHAHVRRLASLHPKSGLIQSIAKQADTEMKQLTVNLITALQAPGLKLAGGMRTVGWLRRVAPDLLSDDAGDPQTASGTTVKHIGSGDTGGTSVEGSLGALFLACRLHSLGQQLGALAPLQALSDAETASRASRLAAAAAAPAKRAASRQHPPASASSSSGQQTERYLKRYIEIFREQSFAIVSMYRSIFPSALPLPTRSPSSPAAAKHAANLLPRPSPLATFCAHLSSLLFTALRAHLPNVTDPSARESLLTQVLYCAGSLGRLGGDFGMQVALLEEDLKAEEEAAALRLRGEEESEDDDDGDKALVVEEWEWERVMKKHRVQASRLELLASGVGTGAGAKNREVGAAG